MMLSDCHQKVVLRKVFCLKLKQDLEGLDRPPYPGELGQKIFEGISKQAWSEWMEYQTKLINELKLKVFEPSAQATIRKHAEDFFFAKS